MDELELELKQCFLEEAEQILDEAESVFLKLEQNASDIESLNEIFRLAHNFKGSSKAVGFDDLADFTHKLEDFILQLKEGTLQATPSTISLLLRCNDQLRLVVDALKEDVEAKIDCSELIAEMVEFRNTPAAEASVAESSSPEEVPEQIDVPSAEDSQWEEPMPEMPSASAEFEEIQEAVAQDPQALSEPEEIPIPPLNPEEISAPPEAILAASLTSEMSKEAAKPPVESSPPPPQKASPAASSSSPSSGGAKGRSEESIRVNLGRLDKLNNFVGELVILQNVIKQNHRDMNSENMQKSMAQLDKLSKEIHEITMSLRMIPIRPLLKKMQRIVRDVSHSLDKKVELRLFGEDTELDKTVSEHLGDPLVHIVRNAIDHGLENPEKRLKAGKSETGRLDIRCFHEGNDLVITIKDDGNGIDPEVIRRKCLQKGIISETQSLKDEELIQLVFHPGFSTKEVVSEFSGRGVGMDVVQTNIRNLSGNVQVFSKKGEGSTFKISLPLTMAIIEGLIAQVNDQKYVMPLQQVHELITLDPKKISDRAGVGSFLALRGSTIPLFNIKDVLGLPREGGDHGDLAVVIKKNEELFALEIDDVLQQQQIVVKGLGDEIKVKRGFMGSSILGNGMPALIFDLHEILAMARQSRTKVRPKAKKESVERVA